MQSSAGLEADGLNRDVTACTAWFYSPEASAYDFRHYSTESYPMTSYEGFDEVGASAVGIGVTSECSLRLVSEFVSEEELTQFGEQIQKPAFYVGTPEYYHEKKAFGYWSLVSRQTETENWIEDQLAAAFEFYREEIDARNWYGLFDYGDFRHTYDPVRHCWRYDMGGYAWQNTELVPTYWLWLYFMRTQREDVLTVAEAMSRHCAEVDSYHFGPMKGIGSRHNVRHWGCSCKEPRVSMAGHHRPFYYLTGDYRMGEALADTKDADQSMVNLKHYHPKLADGSRSEEYLIRSGPDWVSFVSDWMTQYERTREEYYKNKILTGISDLAVTPFGLVSGPEFGYDSNTGNLIYLGEQENGCMHLQICMGGPEIWMEAANYLENTVLADMLAAHGKFYMLAPEEKSAQTGGLIQRRSFSYPYFASALTAYAADRTKDEVLKKAVWKELLHALAEEGDTKGFLPVCYAKQDGQELKEIPWITTNFTAQWCLNAIVVSEFIREMLPHTLTEMEQMLSGMSNQFFHKA